MSMPTDRSLLQILRSESLPKAVQACKEGLIEKIDPSILPDGANGMTAVHDGELKYPIADHQHEGQHVEDPRHQRNAEHCLP